MFCSRDREKCLQLLDRYYPGRKFHDTLYAEGIRKHLRPGAQILDAGYGRYMKFCRELSDVARVVGIDLEKQLDTDNHHATFGSRGDLGHLPFPPDSFDIVISRSVVEHLEDPRLVFREFFRVLRPGGTVVVVTPNKYDYVSVIAAMTPYWLHRQLVSRIFELPEDEVFPTLYRANTLSATPKAFLSAGFIERELDTFYHYRAYLMFSPVLFRFGVLYQRLTLLKPLRWLRSSILGVFEKEGRTKEADYTAAAAAAGVQW
jgi:SAM-dependent methyltransferase